MTSRNIVVYVLAFVVALSTASMAVAADAGHDAGHAEKPALLEWDLGSAFWSIMVPNCGCCLKYRQCLVMAEGQKAT